MFEYGPIDNSNKPPFINKDALKGKKLKMTAAEMFHFVRLFGVLIGDLVSHTNPFWKLYCLLREILEIVMARKLPKTMVGNLRVLIAEHHRLYMELTGNSFKPKFHFVTHAPEVFLQSGPLNNISSIRFEAKHRDLTSPASVNTSRINICRSVAIKHQLALCYRFIENKSILPPMNIGSRTRDLSPEFGQITHIFVSHDILGDVPIFLCKRYLTLGLDSHVLAYEVELIDEKICVIATNLVDPLPVYAHTMSNGAKYIVLRYCI
ncbi:uncharacterized protein [Venturia canescens]|uniref:uncharacterized protein n=1 Tax=Venturia canescens TaxID=32260 RepID=UPI001C9C1164|nr:uncharacterized protein LOC122406301 [Venturia canescens]